jgi:hypothetical protein
VIGARAAILKGIAPGVAAASMIADITTEMIAQLVYVCLGIALLGAQMRHAQGVPSSRCGTRGQLIRSGHGGARIPEDYLFFPAPGR